MNVGPGFVIKIKESGIEINESKLKSTPIAMVAPELKQNSDDTQITKACAVLGCEESKNLRGIQFFRFPEDPGLRQIWTDLTGRNNWTPTDYSYICIQHFSMDSFIYTRSNKRILSEKAVPSLRLPRHVLEVEYIDEETLENEEEEMDEDVTDCDEDMQTDADIKSEADTETEVDQDIEAHMSSKDNMNPRTNKSPQVIMDLQANINPQAKLNPQETTKLQTVLKTPAANKGSVMKIPSGKKPQLVVTKTTPDHKTQAINKPQVYMKTQPEKTQPVMKLQADKIPQVIMKTQPEKTQAVMKIQTNKKPQVIFETQPDIKTGKKTETGKKIEIDIKSEEDMETDSEYHETKANAKKIHIDTSNLPNTNEDDNNIKLLKLFTQVQMMQRQAVGLKDKLKYNMKIHNRQSRFLNRLNQMIEMKKNVLNQKKKKKARILMSLHDKIKEDTTGLVMAMPVRYTDDLKNFALSIYKYSPQSYIYVRNTLRTMLPSTEVLDNWLSSGYTPKSMLTVSNVIKVTAEHTESQLACKVIIQ